MAIKAPSIEDIKAGFVHNPINTIKGEPTYKSIKNLQNQLICNDVTLESTLGRGCNGLAGLVKFLQVYYYARAQFHMDAKSRRGPSVSTHAHASPMQSDPNAICNCKEKLRLLPTHGPTFKKSGGSSHGPDVVIWHPFDNAWIRK
eukprot:15366961-Ditylum_brightwellii.AAC.2